METEVRIRAFRATDDKETCIKFVLGHQKVLENHGIQKVTSSTNAWIDSPSVIVIVVESLDKQKLYGGARIHIANGIDPLPLETATGDMDPRIYDYIKHYSKTGTAELCGLWNSIEVAGLGVGSYFPSRASIVILNQLGLGSLFSLCSPVTLRFNQWIGARVFTEVGNQGTFYYPKIDLLATIIFLEDPLTLNKAHPRERVKMFWMRENLSSVHEEKSPFKNITVKVHYELEVKGIKPNEFNVV